MKRYQRKLKESEVKRTGRIPVGTDVHFKHLRNPSIAYLHRVISQTELLISTGDCHPEWGRKRIAALEKMLDSKERRFETKRMGK